MSRPRVPLAFYVVIGLAACASTPRAVEPSSDVRVSVPRDSLLRIATTQLRIHGYTVAAPIDGAIVTVPRIVPAHLAGSARTGAKPEPTAARRGQRYIIRVETAGGGVTGGTTFRVVGYLLPSGATQESRPVTDRESRLWTELRAAAQWITDAARRR